MSDLLKALHCDRVLLMDGAMGTEIQRAGGADGECYEAWNLTQPDKVRAIHTAYVQAGAEVLLANTFQANRSALARHHQQDNLSAIIRCGLTLAREPLPRAGWVLADIGPVSSATLPELRGIVDASVDADGILLETISDPAQAEALLLVSRSGNEPNKPVLVSFTFDGKTRRTFRGLTPEECARRAADLGVAALGVNCGRELDVAACAEILTRYRAVSSLPLFARPNAGTPIGKVHPRSPAEMAAGALSLLEAGAVMIGGCCGTTPRHTSALRAVVDAWNGRLMPWT